MLDGADSSLRTQACANCRRLFTWVLLLLTFTLNSTSIPSPSLLPSCIILGTLNSLNPNHGEQRHVRIHLQSFFCRGHFFFSGPIWDGICSALGQTPRILIFATQVQSGITRSLYHVQRETTFSCHDCRSVAKDLQRDNGQQRITLQEWEDFGSEVSAHWTHQRQH